MLLPGGWEESTATAHGCGEPVLVSCHKLAFTGGVGVLGTVGVAVLEGSLLVGLVASILLW